MTRHPRARLGLLVAIVAGGVVLAEVTPVGPALGRAARALAEEGRAPWAPPAFVGLYGLALAAGMPGTLLTVVGGAAFGPVAGIPVNLCGALLGATLAFLEGRFLARDAVQMLFGRHVARLGSLASPRRAIWTFFRLRLIPLVPYNGLCFAAGLTDARLGPYLAGTALGIVPSTTVYTLFAAALARGHNGAAVRVGLLLGLFGLVGVAPTLWQLARRRVKSRHGPAEPRRDLLSGAAGPDLSRPRDA